MWDSESRWIAGCSGYPFWGVDRHPENVPVSCLCICLVHIKRPPVELEASLGNLWRRRADSNRRIGVLQTPALDHLATSPCHLGQLSAQRWCRGGDSNSHSLLGHSALNAACLPIPPPRHAFRTLRVMEASRFESKKYYIHGLPVVSTLVNHRWPGREADRPSQYRLSAPESWIQEIPESVPEHVKSEHGEAQGKPRPDREVRSNVELVES